VKSGSGTRNRLGLWPAGKRVLCVGGGQDQTRKVKKVQRKRKFQKRTEQVEETSPTNKKKLHRGKKWLKKGH